MCMSVCCVKKLNGNFLICSRSIFLKTKFEPVASALEQLVAGLNHFDLISKIKENRNIFKFIFCHSKAFTWSYDMLVEKFKVKWSDAGSNRKNKELPVYKHFLEMLERCYYDGMYIKQFLHLTLFMLGFLRMKYEGAFCPPSIS